MGIPKIVVSRNSSNIDSIRVHSYKIEKVDNLKYLGENINNKNEIHIEINERVTNGNKCYFSVIKLLKSKILSRESKIRLYHSYLQPVTTYACKIWSLIKSDGKRPITFKRKALQTIYGPIFNSAIQKYERKSNENMQSLYNRPDVLSFIRRKQLE